MKNSQIQQELDKLLQLERINHELHLTQKLQSQGMSLEQQVLVNDTMQEIGRIQFEGQPSVPQAANDPVRTRSIEKLAKADQIEQILRMRNTHRGTKTEMQITHRDGSQSPPVFKKQVTYDRSSTDRAQMQTLNYHESKRAMPFTAKQKALQSQRELNRELCKVTSKYLKGLPKPKKFSELLKQEQEAKLQSEMSNPYKLKNKFVVHHSKKKRTQAASMPAQPQQEATYLQSKPAEIHQLQKSRDKPLAVITGSAEKTRTQSEEILIQNEVEKAAFILNYINQQEQEEIRDGLIQPNYGLKLDSTEQLPPADPSQGFVIQQMHLTSKDGVSKDAFTMKNTGRTKKSDVLASNESGIVSLSPDLPAAWSLKPSRANLSGMRTSKDHPTGSSDNLYQIQGHQMQFNPRSIQQQQEVILRQAHMNRVHFEQLQQMDQEIKRNASQLMIYMTNNTNPDERGEGSKGAEQSETPIYVNVPQLNFNDTFLNKGNKPMLSVVPESSTIQTHPANINSIVTDEGLSTNPRKSLHNSSYSRSKKKSNQKTDISLPSRPTPNYAGGPFPDGIANTKGHSSSANSKQQMISTVRNSAEQLSKGPGNHSHLYLPGHAAALHQPKVPANVHTQELKSMSGRSNLKKDKTQLLINTDNQASDNNKSVSVTQVPQTYTYNSVKKIEFLTPIVNNGRAEDPDFSTIRKVNGPGNGTDQETPMIVSQETMKIEKSQAEPPSGAEIKTILTYNNTLQYGTGSGAPRPDELYDESPAPIQSKGLQIQKLLEGERKLPVAPAVSQNVLLSKVSKTPSMGPSDSGIPNHSVHWLATKYDELEATPNQQRNQVPSTLGLNTGTQSRAVQKPDNDNYSSAFKAILKTKNKSSLFEKDAKPSTTNTNSGQIPSTSRPSAQSKSPPQAPDSAASKTKKKKELQAQAKQFRTIVPKQLDLLSSGTIKHSVVSKETPASGFLSKRGGKNSLNQTRHDEQFANSNNGSSAPNSSQLRKVVPSPKATTSRNTAKPEPSDPAQIQTEEMVVQEMKKMEQLEYLQSFGSRDFRNVNIKVQFDQKPELNRSSNDDGTLLSPITYIPGGASLQLSQEPFKKDGGVTIEIQGVDDSTAKKKTAGKRNFKLGSTTLSSRQVSQHQVEALMAADPIQNSAPPAPQYEYIQRFIDDYIENQHLYKMKRRLSRNSDHFGTTSQGSNTKDNHTLGILPQIRFNLTRLDPSKQANQTSNSLVSYNKMKKDAKKGDQSSRSRGSQPGLEATMNEVKKALTPVAQQQNEDHLKGKDESGLFLHGVSSIGSLPSTSKTPINQASTPEVIEESHNILVLSNPVINQSKQALMRAANEIVSHEVSMNLKSKQSSPRQITLRNTGQNFKPQVDQPFSTGNSAAVSPLKPVPIMTQQKQNGEDYNIFIQEGTHELAGPVEPSKQSHRVLHIKDKLSTNNVDTEVLPGFETSSPLKLNSKMNSSNASPIRKPLLEKSSALDKLISEPVLEHVGSNESVKMKRTTESATGLDLAERLDIFNSESTSKVQSGKYSQTQNSLMSSKLTSAAKRKTKRSTNKQIESMIRVGSLDVTGAHGRSSNDQLTTELNNGNAHLMSDERPPYLKVPASPSGKVEISSKKQVSRAKKLDMTQKFGMTTRTDRKASLGQQVSPHEHQLPLIPSSSSRDIIGRKHNNSSMNTSNNKSLIPGYLLDRPTGPGLKQSGGIYSSGPFRQKGVSPNNIMLQPSLLGGSTKKNSEAFMHNRDIYHLNMIDPLQKLSKERKSAMSELAHKKKYSTVRNSDGKAESNAFEESKLTVLKAAKQSKLEEKARLTQLQQQNLSQRLTQRQQQMSERRQIVQYQQIYSNTVRPNPASQISSHRHSVNMEAYSKGESEDIHYLPPTGLANTAVQIPTGQTVTGRTTGRQPSQGSYGVGQEYLPGIRSSAHGSATSEMQEVMNKSHLLITKMPPPREGLPPNPHKTDQDYAKHITKITARIGSSDTQQLRGTQVDMSTEGTPGLTPISSTNQNTMYKQKASVEDSVNDYEYAPQAGLAPANNANMRASIHRVKGVDAKVSSRDKLVESGSMEEHYSAAATSGVGGGGAEASDDLVQLIVRSPRTDFQNYLENRFDLPPGRRHQNPNEIQFKTLILGESHPLDHLRRHQAVAPQNKGKNLKQILNFNQLKSRKASEPFQNLAHYKLQPLGQTDGLSGPSLGSTYVDTSALNSKRQTKQTTKFGGEGLQKFGKTTNELEAWEQMMTEKVQASRIVSQLEKF